jgi:hypothetical protein
MTAGVREGRPTGCLLGAGDRRARVLSDVYVS